MSDRTAPVEGSKPPEVAQVRTCERCGKVPAVIRTMLSIYTGKTVRMFECSCGERIWSEE